MKPLFAPSLMCADLLSIKEQVEILNDRADLYHIDIMDGHFVRNFSLSPSFVEQIKPVAKLPITELSVPGCWRIFTSEEAYRVVALP